MQNHMQNHMQTKMQTSARLNDLEYAECPETRQETDPVIMSDNALVQARVIPLFSPGRVSRARQVHEIPHTERNKVVALPQAAGRRFVSDFDRDVYCLLGIPIDAVDMDFVLQHVRNAASRKQQCFLSTPNLNFLMGCQRDASFRESLINSDLNIVDGLPLAWMARRLGIPVRRRVTGSGLFEALMAGAAESGRKLSVYFFGGREGVAQAACQNLNTGAYGLSCAGFQSPGFGSVQELSSQETIDRINASNADFLVVSLGAHKGQDWIEHNRRRLTTPVISHLGAVVNFVAGTVNRAPGRVQRLGLEWLWRIKEEPALWSRYWRDGIGMLHLMATRLLPHALYLGSRRATAFWRPECASIRLVETTAGCRITLSGAVPDQIPRQMRAVLRDAASLRTDVMLDMSGARHLSPAFFGLLLVLRKHQAAAGKSLGFIGLSRDMQRLFRWNGVEYLLSDNQEAPAFNANKLVTAEATSL